MPFIYNTGNGLAASNTAISPFDSTTSGYYTGRAKIGTNSYWGRYSVSGFPISFDRDMEVDNFGILVNNFDGGFPGAQMRLWIYESDALGLPRTLTWDAGVLTGINTTPGFFNLTPASSATLEARKKYWVISQQVLEDGITPGDVDINAEDFGTTFYVSMTGTELDPLASYAWIDANAVAFSTGAMGGLYIDELQSPGWNPGNPAPATLTGDMNDGFYPTSYTATVWLRAVGA